MKSYMSSIVLVVATFLATGCVASHFSAECLESGQYPAYSLSGLPYDCVPLMTPCATNFCACKSMEFDTSAKECVATGSGSSSMSCSDTRECVRDYLTCVDVAYAIAEEQAALDNCTTDTDKETLEYVHSQLLDFVINGSTFNETDLYTACSQYVCETANVTGCNSGDDDLYAYDLCKEPSVIENPLPPNPWPTNPDGSLAVPKTVVRLRMVIAQDFDTLASTPEGRRTMREAIEESFTARFGVRTFTRTVTYQTTTGQVVTATRRRMHQALSDGNLDSMTEAEVAKADSATLKKLLDNIDELKKSKSTSWLRALARACKCVIKGVSLTSSIDGEGTASKCGSGCIAGVVVGGTVAVGAGVGAVAYVTMSKTASVTPTPMPDK